MELKQGLVISGMGLSGQCALQKFLAAHVAYGSSQRMHRTPKSIDVRFAPKSDSQL